MCMNYNYEIIFYTTVSNHCPVDEFLDSLNLKPRAKVLRWLEQLEILGPNLKRPYADVIKGKIRELRIPFGSNSYRIFYFFFIKKQIVLTHGITKKTNKIPLKEIKKAENYMNDFTKRFNDGGIEL